MTGGGPYAVAWAPTALRTLARLPEKVSTAVVEFVYGVLADNPQRVGHELRFELQGKYSARRGDYRIVYEVDEEEREVVIPVVDRRKRVYRPR